MLNNNRINSVGNNNVALQYNLEWKNFSAWSNKISLIYQMLYMNFVIFSVHKLNKTKDHRRVCLIVIIKNYPKIE